MMGIFSKLTDLLGGSLFGDVTGLIKDYFPPEMTESQKAGLEKEFLIIENEAKLRLQSAINDADKQFNKRINDHEGTANDLKQMPVIGSIVLFLRGVQRPAWGFFTMYLNFVWFVQNPVWTEQQESAVMVINILVLGFLFGERAVKNLSPIIEKMFAKGK